MLQYNNNAPSYNNKAVRRTVKKNETFGFWLQTQSYKSKNQTFIFMYNKKFNPAIVGVTIFRSDRHSLKVWPISLGTREVQNFRETKISATKISG